LFVSCNDKSKSTDDIPSVNNVDLSKYVGKWYEIARLPHSFEKDLVNVTATYEILDNGKIRVINEGYKKSPDGKISTAKGKAWIPDSRVSGVLKVSFFWPFSANYKIILLDKDYKYAVVTSNTKKYLWFLSRTLELDDKTYNQLINFATEKGFQTENLIKVLQSWK